MIDIKRNKEILLYELSTIDREGIDKLAETMEAKGFFTAPCSGGHHLACEGGLAEHSLNVLVAMRKLSEALEANLDFDSITLVALLHDLGKCGDHGEQNYIPNILKSGKQSDSKPYVTNPAIPYEEHEIRSLLIAERCIYLRPEEETAILHHNGLFGKLDSAFGNHNFDSSPLALLLHFADMWASRFEEE